MSVTAPTHRPATALLLFASLLLLVTVFSGHALAAICNDSTNNHLADITGGTTVDLQVTGPCEVKAGVYTFHSVNIYSSQPNVIPGGTLNFDDATIDFYAENIVVESGGSLIAATLKPFHPIGLSGGVVTIHLWGAAAEPGVTCKSTNCGVPKTIWGSNPRTMPPQLRPTRIALFPSCRAT